MRSSRSGKRFAVFASKRGFSRECKTLLKAVNKQLSVSRSGGQPEVGHIQLQPVNASVAAVTLMPGVTVRGVLLLVWLV